MRGLKQIYFLFFCLSVFFSCHDTKQALPLEGKTPVSALWQMVDTSCVIGIVALDMEQKSGLTVKTGEYSFIDDFLHSLQSLIGLQSDYSPQEALNILQTIDIAIRQRRTQQVTYESAFSTCLRYGLFDCDINSLLYLSVAEHLQLPIYGLMLPNHMLVLWRDGTNQIYWETTEGQERSVEFYLEKYGIEERQVGKNGILTPMSKQDLLAIISFNIGKDYADKDIFEEGIRYSREAIDLHRDWSNPYLTLATVYQKKDLPENALYYSRQAIQRFDRNKESYRIMTWAYQTLGCDTEAEKAFQQYWKLHNR